MAHVWRNRVTIILCGLLVLIAPVAAQSTASGVPVYVAPQGEPAIVHLLPDASSPPLMQLNSETPFYALGRRDDNTWVALDLGDDLTGWVTSVHLRTDAQTTLPTLPITTPEADLILRHASFWNITTPHVQTIYDRGQQRGRRPDFFTTVGDSITASSMFLTPLGHNVYNLGPFQNLEAVLTHYGTIADTPFNHRSAAVRSGWTTRDVLDPARGARSGCLSGMTPLICEFTFSNPSVAVIMLGTNDATIMTVDEFEQNLDYIAALTLEADIIPLLSTIPPLYLRGQDTTPYNHAIIRVSENHRVPLVNLWLALQPLPNTGVAPDGVHLSAPPSNAGTTLFTGEYIEYGYTMRNLVTLQALDALTQQN